MTGRRVHLVPPFPEEVPFDAVLDRHASDDAFSKPVFPDNFDDSGSSLVGQSFDNLLDLEVSSNKPGFVENDRIFDLVLPLSHLIQLAHTSIIEQNLFQILFVCF